MADRLEDQLRQQRAFAGDASHQLRTPLTALRVRLDNAADLVDADPDAARETVAAAQDEALRLQQIVDGLLALSRADDAAIAPQEIDLAEVARARVEQWQPLAEESGVHIAVTAPDMAPALAVPGAAEQIIDNLIDNALAVSPADTTIGVTVTPASDTVDLHVLDEGPGMSSQDCARAFDRFWRGRTDTVGSGLGLAIVAQLARASGAAARVDTTHVGQHRYRRTRCAHPVCSQPYPSLAQRDSALRSSSAPSRTPADAPSRRPRSPGTGWRPAGFRPDRPAGSSRGTSRRPRAAHH